MDRYTRIKRGGKVALVQAWGAELLAAALLDGEGCVPVGEAGRGVLMRFSCPQGQGILRQYRRGGWIRHVLSDAYLLVNRPVRELQVHAELYTAGLAVPMPLGVCWERRGLLVRGAFASVEIPGMDLCAWLRSGPENAGTVVARCGALIRQMHDLHVWHADLQVKNVVIAEERPYLIDFDKAVIKPHLSPVLRARNLLRLRRSFDKNGLAPDFFRPLCEGYGMELLPGWLSRLYAVKGRLSDLASGRTPE